MKKGWIIFGAVSAVLLGAVGVVAAGAWSLFGEIVTAANTVRKVQDGLYAMEFKGDYGFDEFLERGGASSDEEVAKYLTEFLSKGFYSPDTEIKTEKFGCSTLAVKDGDGNAMFGRNYDWKAGDAMIVRTQPTGGYASVSTCYLDFLGFGEGFAPDEGMMNRIMSLAAIYVPLDGMNEEGLMIADLMAGDDEATHQATDKIDLTTTSAIRLLLDKAATVDEAVALLQEYDMNSSIGAAHHFSIADKSGKSVVVEYIGGEMVVTETKVVTNFYLAEGEKFGVGSEQSHLRYDELLDKYEQSNGVMNFDELCQAMQSVAQYNYPQDEGSYEQTVWTLVYQPEKRRLPSFSWKIIKRVTLSP